MVAFKDMTDDEKRYVILNATDALRGNSNLTFGAAVAGALFDVNIMRELQKPQKEERFWVRINKKPAHNVKKSHKTERKVSR